jgi:hypothetical protein
MLTVTGPELSGRIRRTLPEIKQAVERESRKFGPVLVRAAQARASGEVDQRIARSGTAKASRDGFVVRFGGTGRVSGTPLREITRPYEFGTSNPDRFSEPYRARHRVSGRAMRVSRRTMRQLPQQSETGRFLYPALADVTPALVGRYVRAITNTVRDA